MPLIRRWKSLSLVWQLTIALAAAIVVIGGLVIGLVALAAANSTHDDLRVSVDCLNNAAGNRNAPSTRDAQAHIAFARADKAYDKALVTVLVTPKGPGQLAAFKAFVLAAQDKRGADAEYVKQLQVDQNYRRLHPLGRC